MRTARERRAELLALRIRLERVAADGFDRCCRPGASGHQFNLRARLLFVVAAAEPTDRDRVHRLVRLGLHVYRKSSDALHGRVAALGLPDALMDEWIEVVSSLEAVLDEGPPQSAEAVGGQ